MPRLLLATAVLAALAPTPARAQQPDPGLALVPADRFAFVSVKVSKLWDDPAAKPFRDWVAAQTDGVLEGIMGVPFAKIDRVTMIAASADSRDEEFPIFIVTTREKYTQANVLKALAGGFGGDGKEPQIKGKVAQVPRRNGPFRTVMFAGDRVLVFTDRTLQEREANALLTRLAKPAKTTTLAKALAAARTHDIVAGVNFSRLGYIERDILADKDAEPLRPLLKAKAAMLIVDVEKTAKGELILNFPEAKSAKEGADALAKGLSLLADHLATEAKGTSNPLQKEIFNFGLRLRKATKVATLYSDAVAAAEIEFADDVTKLVAGLPKSLKQQFIDTTTANNLKQLGLAMHNFESAFSYFPGDVGFPDKPAASSWRVMIMPYFDADGADQFMKLDFTKPLDDPKNLKLLEAMQMPKIFEHPGRPAPKGHTYFRIFSLPKNAKGTDRPFLKEGEAGPKVTSITDGTSNTFMIVEAAEAVPWYKPDVLAYDGKLPLPQLGDKDAETFWVVFADGSVRKIKRNLEEKTLRALITISSGEIVQVPK